MAVLLWEHYWLSYRLHYYTVTAVLRPQLMQRKHISNQDSNRWQLPDKARTHIISAYHMKETIVICFERAFFLCRYL